jgi:hypothetical protein
MTRSLPMTSSQAPAAHGWRGVQPGRAGPQRRPLRSLPGHRVRLDLIEPCRG